MPTPTASHDETFYGTNERIVAILERYVSRPIARSICDLARQRTGLREERLERADLRRLLEAIERGLRLFLSDPKGIVQVRAALYELVSSEAAPDAAPEKLATPLAVRREILCEDDISRARSDARELATRLGLSVVEQTKLLTAVSELTRNIVLYAGSGNLELTVRSDGAVEIVAQDRGPGIADLDRILRGEYRSQKGMGLGLRGVKRLMQSFSVRTAAGHGTIVRATLAVGRA